MSIIGTLFVPRGMKLINSQTKVTARNSTFRLISIYNINESIIFWGKEQMVFYLHFPYQQYQL